MGKTCSTICVRSKVTPNKIMTSPEPGRHEYGIPQRKTQETDFLPFTSTDVPNGLKNITIEEGATVTELESEGEAKTSEHSQDFTVSGKKEHGWTIVNFRDRGPKEGSESWLGDFQTTEPVLEPTANSSDYNNTVSCLAQGPNYKSGPSDESNNKDYHSIQQCDHAQKPGPHFLDGETLIQMLGDECSTGGTAGSEEGSYMERVEPIENDIAFYDVMSTEDDVVDDEFTTKNGRGLTLTSFSLENLNTPELDRTERVRNFIQAWEPPGIATSSESLDETSLVCDNIFVQSNLRELSQFQENEDEEDNMFYKHSPSNLWSYREGRAPWGDKSSMSPGYRTIGFHGIGTLPRIEDEGPEDCNWSTRDGWNNSSKSLTLCSMSTINEESDGNKDII